MEKARIVPSTADGLAEKTGEASIQTNETVAASDALSGTLDLVQTHANIIDEIEGIIDLALEIDESLSRMQLVLPEYVESRRINTDSIQDAQLRLPSEERIKPVHGKFIGVGKRTDAVNTAYGSFVVNLKDRQLKDSETDLSNSLSLTRSYMTAAQAEGQAAALDLSSPSARASKSSDDIAAALANPVASLISIPFQSNLDFGAGPDGDGVRYTMNLQPVIPIAITEDWNLITRTIVPIIAQDADFSAFSSESEFGLGDTVVSGFFSPKNPIKLTDTANLTWGIGPAIYIPTATDSELGADQWGLGPTAVALVVDGPLTYGALVNHIWSVGRTEDFDDFIVDRPALNNTFFQPFVTYGLGDGWSVTANAEASYDWESDQWTVPVGAFVAKVFSIGGQTFSLSAGPRYYAEGPTNAPDWGFRVSATLVFPF
jgi:hypothetical protein